VSTSYTVEKKEKKREKGREGRKDRKEKGRKTERERERKTEKGRKKGRTALIITGKCIRTFLFYHFFCPKFFYFFLRFLKQADSKISCMKPSTNGILDTKKLAVQRGLGIPACNPVPPWWYTQKDWALETKDRL
jgi:hypothetical protein